jgi:hypothetical protein
MKLKILLHSTALHTQIYLITNSFGSEGRRHKAGRGFADFVEESAKASVLTALESLEEHTTDLLTNPAVVPAFILLEIELG